MGIQKDIFFENKRLENLNPLVCGEQENDPGRSFGPVIRAYWLLHFVFSGEGEFLTPRGLSKVKKGQIFVIRPGEMTLYTADRKNPWHYCWLGFQSGFDLSEILHSDVLDAPECSRVFYSLLESRHINPGKEWYICGKAYEILALLSDKAGSKNTTGYYVKVAQDYIEAHYNQSIRVKALADSLGLSRIYFSRIFKQYTGKSPQQYIVDLRLNKAAEYMRHQSLSLGETAQMVGYHDLLNFSRMFRRRFGMSPSEYRKNIGQTQL